MKKYKTRKIKGIRIVTEIKGRKDRLLMPRPAVFDLKTKYDRNREKRQTRKEIEFLKGGDGDVSMEPVARMHQTQQCM